MAEILTDSDADLDLAAGTLRAGALVAIPTETVYGLAANAFCEAAVRQIFAVKSRPFIDPLIVHVHSLEQAGTLADISHPFVKRLAEAFWPGPLTLVLPKKKIVPDLVTAGHPTVAIRMPAHPVARKILQRADLPLAAPSANQFGYVSPTTAQHVQDSLGDRLRYIVDGGRCDCGVESAIVLVGDNPVLLRPGVISRERLEACLGVPVALGKGLMETAADKGMLAPGLLKKHYSPRTRVELFEGVPAEENAAGTAVVWQRRPADPGAGTLSKNVFWLSEDGDQTTVARNIFEFLRRLDGMGFSKIYIERSPDGGIGTAVNDRLSRAAAKL
ncbi:MAG: threonylcarbamoyl-AMP synthase [Opitutales bacterium]|nr:threonylcarbamoyl-AMP synthase [Opitutales bacterium]